MRQFTIEDIRAMLQSVNTDSITEYSLDNGRSAIDANTGYYGGISFEFNADGILIEICNYN